MPAFKGEGFIKEAIESIQIQTLGDWELWVIDDFSPDRTVEIVHSISKNDARVRLLRNVENLGPLVSRNIALEGAEGRFVAFLDQDDVWLRGKLKMQLDFMLAGNIGVSFTSWRRMTPNGLRQGRVINAPTKYGLRELNRNTGVALSSCMIDRKIVGEPKFADVRPFTEYEFYQRMFQRGIIAQGLRVDLLRYRVSSGGISYNKAKMARMVWDNFRRKGKLPFASAVYCFLNYAALGVLRNFDRLREPRTD